MILVLLITDFLAVTKSSDNGAEIKPYAWRKRPITKFEGRDLCEIAMVSIRNHEVQCHFEGRDFCEIARVAISI